MTTSLQEKKDKKEKDKKHKRHKRSPEPDVEPIIAQHDSKSCSTSYTKWVWEHLLLMMQAAALSPHGFVNK